MVAHGSGELEWKVALRSPRLLRLPWTIGAFAILFIFAEGVKLAGGDTEWAIIDAILALFFAGACRLTKGLTPEIPLSARKPGRLLPVQLAACAIVFVATLFQLPGWSGMRSAIYDLAALHLSAPFANGVANFWTYCIPIAVVLFLLRMPLRAQGLGPFRRGSLLTALIWLAVPLVPFAWAFFSGKATAATIGLTWLSNLLQNGVSEEFLWRGAILGVLLRAMRTEYALLVQALFFAAWHWHADMTVYHNTVSVIADMIASQALFALAAGYVTVRTGNIAIASGFHLLFDSLQLFQ